MSEVSKVWPWASVEEIDANCRAFPRATAERLHAYSVEITKMVVVRDHYIDQLTRERDQLKAELAQAQLMPGAWRCKQCGFTLQKNVLHAMDGTVSADSSPLNEKCPNDGALMAPLTWRETNEDLYKIACERLAENTTLRAHNAALLEACKEIAKGEGDFHRDPLVHAENTIQNMKQLARTAIALEKGEK